MALALALSRALAPVAEAQPQSGGLRSNWEAIFQTIKARKPVVLNLTETKLLTCMNTSQHIKAELPEYYLHHSSLLRTPHANTPAQRLDILGSHLGCILAPPGAKATGNYLPQTRTAPPGPWTNTDLDPFTLETPAQPLRHQLEALTYLMEPSVYQTCVKHLAKNKEAGPDTILNETLQCIPLEWHTTIHQLFTLMWIMGHTPKCWKTSKTVMLYRKGEPTAPSNYKPVGLNNTLAKLWTSMVTAVTASIAEHHNILREAQEGFRQHRSTHRQLARLLNDIEDAALTNQDLLVGYFDFSNAFNMINHDIPLCTLYDLGLPNDLIDTIKGIYTQASTHVTLEGHQGPPIDILRGASKGTPSPHYFVSSILNFSTDGSSLEAGDTKLPASPLANKSSTAWAA
eukprot:gene21318-biopygen30035